MLVDAQENLTVLDWDWRIGDARFDIAWAVTLMRCSSFNDFSAAIATEYEYQSAQALTELAYFEVLATVRWLLNVTHSLAQAEGLRQNAYEDFRDFLKVLVHAAIELVHATTGAILKIPL